MQDLSLSVYTDPWIDITMCDGKRTTQGIRYTIEHADEIEDITVADCLPELDKAMPFVLAELILTRVYRPQDKEDKADLFQRRCFDINRVDQYIEDCERRGISFDVFDKDHPFLQCDSELSQQVFKATSESPVASIEPFALSGNNTVFHYRYGYLQSDAPAEQQFSMSPAQYTASLIRNMVFHAPSGGYTCTGNGSQPPLFVVPEGESLFESLVASMPECVAGEDVPMWERKEYLPDIPKLAAEHMGFLGSTLLPVMYIRYGDISDGRVHTVMTSPIKYSSKKYNRPCDYKEAFITNAPWYLWKRDKKGRLRVSILKPETSPWYEMASFDSGCFAETLTGMDFFRYLADSGMYPVNEEIACRIIGLTLPAKSSEPYQDIFNLSVPEQVLAPEGSAALRIVVKLLRKYNSSLHKALNNYEWKSVVHEEGTFKTDDDGEIRSASTNKGYGAGAHISALCRACAEDENNMFGREWLWKIAELPTQETLSDILTDAREFVIATYDRYRPTRDDIMSYRIYRHQLNMALAKETNYALGEFEG